MTPLDVANAVVNSSASSGPEGFTNREKFHFVCYVFDVKAVCLGHDFPYEDLIETRDPQMIRAGMFLASLQWEYSTRCHLNGLVGEERHQQVMSYLLLAQSKMRWAMTFVAIDREPAPYPFVN